MAGPNTVSIPGLSWSQYGKCGKRQHQRKLESAEPRTDRYSFLGASGGARCWITASELHALGISNWHDIDGPTSQLTGSSERFPLETTSPLGHLFRLHRGRLAGRRGSTYQAGFYRYFPGRDFSDHGHRRFPGAMEPARVDPRYVVGSRRRSARAAFGHLGRSRGLPLGSSQYSDHLCHSRCGFEHRLPALEFEQLARDFLGISFLQRTPPSRLAPLERRARRRARHVFGRHSPGDRFFHARPGGTFVSWRLGRARCGCPLGNDVYSLPQSVSHGHEPALVRDLLHLRRTRHDVRASDRLSRPVSALAGTALCPCRDFLAHARRLHLGRRRFVPAIRRQIHRNQPRHSSFQFESALGTVVGNLCFWRTAQP